jgi:acetate kinase
MLILVANLGSTSFKYRLFRMDESGGEVVAKGGYERVEDYAGVIDDALATLQRDGVIASPDEIDAVGFKTVLGKNLSGCVIADQAVIDALEGFRRRRPRAQSALCERHPPVREIPAEGETRRALRNRLLSVDQRRLGELRHSP